MDDYIQQEFYLPESYKDKFHKYKDQPVITYDDFIAEEGMIPVTYEYILSTEDMEYLLKLIAEKVGLKVEGDILLFLRELYDDDTDDIATLLNDYLEYNKKSKDILEKLKEHCKSKAYDEFLYIFDYWVDEEDLEKYYVTEEVTDFE